MKHPLAKLKRWLANYESSDAKHLRMLKSTASKLESRASKLESTASQLESTVSQLKSSNKKLAHSASQLESAVSRFIRVRKAMRQQQQENS